MAVRLLYYITRLQKAARRCSPSLYYSMLYLYVILYVYIYIYTYVYIYIYIHSSTVRYMLYYSIFILHCSSAGCPEMLAGPLVLVAWCRVGASWSRLRYIYIYIYIYTTNNDNNNNNDDNNDNNDYYPRGLVPRRRLLEQATRWKRMHQ